MPNKPRPAPRGWLWTEDAADYLGVAVTTLYRWRRDDIGPKGKRHGQRRLKYKISDLDAWLDGEHEDADEPARAAA
jgi:predicted DNA-binding transcriptional regulator AlpA